MDISSENHTPLKDLSFSSDSTSFIRSSSLKNHAINSINLSATSATSLSMFGYDSSKPLGINSNASSTNIELIQARIDHLEKDRIELTLQLHRRDEKDRSRALKIDSLESKVRSIEEERFFLSNSCKILSEEVNVLRLEKSRLVLENDTLVQSHELEATAELKQLSQKFSSTSSELKKTEDELLELKTRHINVCEEKVEMYNQLQQMQSKLDLTQSELMITRDELKSLNESNSKLIDEVEGHCINLNELNRKNESISIINSHLVEENKSLQNEVEDLRKYQTEYLKEEKISAEKSELLKVVKELTEKLNQSESKRRLMHNKIQELQGNIRVFVRCRPFLKGDEEDELLQTSCLQCHQDEATISVAIPLPVSVTGSNRAAATTAFTFDKVFKSESKQQEIYYEVSNLVQSALDGYRVCIFSYGQTGSGKTHTMTGSLEDENNKGIIPRAIEQILNESNSLQSQGWQIAVNLSVVEIYNEDVRDLLSSIPSNNQNSLTVSTRVTIANNSNMDSDHNKGKFKITKVNGRIVVNGLTSYGIDTADIQRGVQQFRNVIGIATDERTTASTAMNETSSRSHLIVMIDIVGKHPDGVTVMHGGLRLCDLAGSERLDRTGTSHDAARLKETVNINKSLSCLADVFLALNNKASHVPYRNSKLTMLLQDCLSGDGKAMMFVNVSPTQASGQETLCSLKFANQVSQVELGKANKHVYTAPLQVTQESQQSTPNTTSHPVQTQPAQVSTSVKTVGNSNSRSSILPMRSNSVGRGSESRRSSSIFFENTRTSSRLSVCFRSTTTNDEEFNLNPSIVSNANAMPISSVNSESVVTNLVAFALSNTSEPTQQIQESKVEINTVSENKPAKVIQSVENEMIEKVETAKVSFQPIETKTKSVDFTLPQEDIDRTKPIMQERQTLQPTYTTFIKDTATFTHREPLRPSNRNLGSSMRMIVRGNTNAGTSSQVAAMKLLTATTAAVKAAVTHKINKTLHNTNDKENDLNQSAMNNSVIGLVGKKGLSSLSSGPSRVSQNSKSSWR
eukprot:gene5679-7839_t